MLHILNLDTVGGVEELFVAFLRATSFCQHHVLITGKRPHHFFKKILDDYSLKLEKYLFGIKLPKSLRTRRRERFIEESQASSLIFWNRIEPAPKSTKARSVYYEHGASWIEPLDSPRKAYFSQMDLLLANSHAARRLMQLKWGITQPIQLIENPLKPTITCALSSRAPFDLSKRPFVLGYIGRLIPLKGVPILLHALRMLIAGGLPVRCLIAGEGQEKSSLQKLAASLGIASHIQFVGCVQDVARFYGSIDLLVVPSIREPLGLVAQEAGLCGCPVIASRVDGLPEVVHDGASGVCLPPTLDITQYPQLGGTLNNLPDCVYDPHADCLVPPKLLDPALLAACIQKLCTSPEEYVLLSAGAIECAKKRPTIVHYTQALLDALMKDRVYSHRK